MTWFSFSMVISISIHSYLIQLDLDCRWITIQLSHDFLQVAYCTQTQYLCRCLRTRFRQEFLHKLNEDVYVSFCNGIIKGYADASDRPVTL